VIASDCDVQQTRLGRECRSLPRVVELAREANRIGVNLVSLEGIVCFDGLFGSGSKGSFARVIAT
jgi:hypothetical protein